MNDAMRGTARVKHKVEHNTYDMQRLAKLSGTIKPGRTKLDGVLFLRVVAAVIAATGGCRSHL